jgi:hypothetical protein
VRGDALTTVAHHASRNLVNKYGNIRALREEAETRAKRELRIKFNF